jgi:hypothetical protein
MRHTAAHFLELAGQNGWTSADRRTGADDLTRTRALLLGYKLAFTAWRCREGRPDAAVVERVRKRMLTEVGSTSGGGRVPPGSRVLDTADSDIATALLRFEAGLPGPLTPFYGDLAPAFGGPCSTPELAGRYGKVVRHLFEGLERKVDERLIHERSSVLTRYAGA